MQIEDCCGHAPALLCIFLLFLVIILTLITALIYYTGVVRIHIKTIHSAYNFVIFLLFDFVQGFILKNFLSFAETRVS